MSKRKEIKNEPAFILLQIDTIKENPNNPRVIKDDKYKKLVKSIQDFPQMLKLRPLVIDENNIVLGGNMRLKALRELKYKVVPCVRADALSEEQKKEFIIKDNIGYGEWDWDILANEWDEGLLDDWGVDVLALNPNVDLTEFFKENELHNDDKKDKIVLEYNPELCEQVKAKLLEISDKCEDAVLVLLKMDKSK